MAEVGSKAVEVSKRAVDQILNVAIEGVGPFAGAEKVADEIRANVNNGEEAILRLIRVHVRYAATNGAVTGIGGLLTLPLTVPAGLGGYYLIAARLAAGIAYLRGYDLRSEDVRTALLVVMLGSVGTEIIKDTGVTIGTKGLASALAKVPGTVFIEINKKVGFRLITKGGSKGVLNMGKLVPFVGAPIGGTTDLLSMRAVGRYARSAFPTVTTA